jgi:hypothetical protein
MFVLIRDLLQFFPGVRIEHLNKKKNRNITITKYYIKLNELIKIKKNCLPPFTTDVIG